MFRLRRPAASLAICLAMAALLLPVGVVAGSADDLLPDLRMAKPSEIRLDTDGAGRRLLRFSALIINAGQGPLLVRGKRDCATSECPKMTTVQRIRQTDGSWRGVPTARAGKFDVGDGHNHWHVMRFQRYELFELEPPPEVPGVALRGAKTGFCFFDTSAPAGPAGRSPATGVLRAGLRSLGLDILPHGSLRGLGRLLRLESPTPVDRHLRHRGRALSALLDGQRTG